MPEVPPSGLTLIGALRREKRWEEKFSNAAKMEKSRYQKTKNCVNLHLLTCRQDHMNALMDLSRKRMVKRSETAHFVRT